MFKNNNWSYEQFINSIKDLKESDKMMVSLFCKFASDDNKEQIIKWALELNYYVQKNDESGIIYVYKSKDFIKNNKHTEVFINGRVYKF